VTLSPDHLAYPHRRRGMDHDRYAWSPLPARPPVAWPGGGRVALVVMPTLQWFPLDMTSTPFVPVGAPDEPYPDYRTYSHRDYGNRVGIFRIMSVLDRLGLPATCRVNGIIAKRHPDLLAEVVRRRWEVAAYGWHMGRTHHAGLRPEDEAGLIEQTLGVLRRATGQPVAGWLSPGGTESAVTLDLLAAHGVTYVLDWAHDELPSPLRTASGLIHSMPQAPDMDDTICIWQNRHSTDEFADAIMDAYQLLDREATDRGGRVLPIALHPWIVGQPHRIGTLDRVLTDLAGRAGVWPATAAQVLAAFTSQQERTA
jgi:allantoinase